MSSDTDAEFAAAFLEAFQATSVASSCGVAAAALFIYDTLITFDREVASFWTPKWAGPPLLFFANKWLSVMFLVLPLAAFVFSPVGQSCSSLRMTIEAIGALQSVPGAVFSALRAYVLSRSKLLGLLVLTLSLAPAGANLVHFGYHVSGDIFPPFGCLQSDTTTGSLNLRLTIISRVPLIVADMILIYITWAKLRDQDAPLKGIGPSKGRLSLSDILFRNGILYFVVLFILNVLHLVLTATAIATDGAGYESVVTLFTAPLSAILISRFLLDLQEANRTVIRIDSDDPLYSNELPSFISSLGAFIDPDRPASPDSEDDGSDLYISSHRSDVEEEGEGNIHATESTPTAHCHL